MAESEHKMNNLEDTREKNTRISRQDDTEVDKDQETNAVESSSTTRKYPNSEYISAPVKAIHSSMFQRMFKLLLDKGLFFNDTLEQKLKPPSHFEQPEILLKHFDFKLGNQGSDMETLFKLFEQIIELSPHNSHCYKINGNGSGLNPYGIAGDILATTMNTVVLTYIYAPVFTLMEHVVYDKFREMAGYDVGNGDGVFTPDQRIADTMAICSALQMKFKRDRYYGRSELSEKCTFFFASHSQFQYQMIAHFLRLKNNCAISVNTDEKGQMSISDLKTQIQKSLERGQSPFMVIGVAGTSSLGVIDPLVEISRICKSYKVWFHVNASIGGACLFSDKHKYRLRGIELSDSFTWNADTVLASPFSYSILICRTNKILSASFALDSPIVFLETDLWDPKWDTGDRTIQTSRRPDVLIIWYMFKAYGQNGLGNHVNYVYQNTEYFVTELKKRAGAGTFRLVLDNVETPRVAFYYIPKDLRNKGSEVLTKFGARITEATEKIQAYLLIEGVMHIQIQSLVGKPKHFLVSLNNSALTKQDMVYILDQIEYVGLGVPKTHKSSALNNDDYDPEASEIIRDDPPRPPPPPKKFPSFVSAPIEKLHKKFFQDLFSLFETSGLYFQKPDSEAPPLQFYGPDELLKLLDFDLKMDPLTNQELLHLARKIIKYSSHQSNTHYLFQLKSGLEPYSIAADYLLAVTSTSSATYEDAPVYTLMENEVVQVVREKLGYPNTGFEDGIIVPGGSLSNIYAQRVALFKLEGLTIQSNTRHVVYISDAAHYCNEKGAILIGVGENNCVLVETNEKDQMIPEELTKKIEKTLMSGGTPFLVVATFGTTVAGAIDPIGEIANICDRYKLWLHVDASLGGTLILSENGMRSKPGLKSALARTNSFSFNSHKWLCVPVTSSVFVVREHGLLRKAISVRSAGPGTSLYNQDIWDNSQKHLQTHRRADILKFWMAWKAKGTHGFAKHIDHTIEVMQFAMDEIKRRSDRFQLTIPRFELVCICFHYIPVQLRDMKRESQEFKNAIQKVGYILQDRVILGQKLVFVLEETPRHPLFIKLNFQNSALLPEDIIQILDIIDQCGQDIVV